MQTTTFKCDGCKTNLGEESYQKGRWVKILRSMKEEDLDLCEECWRKMCAAVGINSLKLHR